MWATQPWQDRLQVAMKLWACAVLLATFFKQISGDRVFVRIFACGLVRKQGCDLTV